MSICTRVHNVAVLRIQHATQTVQQHANAPTHVHVVLLEPSQHDLADFLADNDVHIIASLPCYLEVRAFGENSRTRVYCRGSLQMTLKLCSCSG